VRDAKSITTRPGRIREILRNVWREKSFAREKENIRFTRRKNRRVAQLAEHRSPKPVVAGSRPVSPASKKA
jgi:hypothetical protein